MKQSRSSWFARLRSGWGQLFVEAIPVTEVPPTPNESVDWHQTATAGIEPDWVIDFGTTATVVGEVHRLGDRVTPAFLVGSNEFPSDMAIQDSQVMAVGTSAREYFTKHQESELRTSFKRYIELTTRHNNPGTGDQLSQLIKDFLGLALEHAGAHWPGRNSNIAVSVPNSFNPTAVECIRQGILRALRKLGAEDIAEKNICVIRESEAVAYLYVHGGRLTNVPTGIGDKRERLEWADLQFDRNGNLITTPGAPTPLTKRSVLVFDVGGGTTDLTIFDVPHSSVIMNAGVPIGGSDVDKIFFCALLKDGFRREDKVWADRAPKYLPLLDIRSEKDKNQGIFLDALAHQGDLAALCGKWSNSPHLAPLVIPLRDAVQIGDEIKRKIAQLVSLSVEGLFDLVPASAWDDVDRVLLTGRGSQLSHIRRAVWERATAHNVPVNTIRHPYHLKLAVACGCALVRADDFRGRRLPTATLGRRLVLHAEGGRMSSIEFDASLPIPTDRPILWRANVPHGKYRVFEYRTQVTEELVQQLGVDAFRHLGLAKEVLNFDCQGSSNQSQYFMWHPVAEQYFKSSVLSEVQWTRLETDQDAAHLQIRNPMTGLSMGFPDVV